MEKTFLPQVAKNAFRVLGLPADTPQKSISERAAALDRAAKVGMIRPPSPWDLKWLGPLQQDRSSISDALGRLSNPQQRLKERLFWFAQSDLFVADISPETLESTIATLQASLFPDDRHDAAVLALASCFSTDTAVHDAERWHEMLQMWTALVESEDFWNGFFDIERSGDFVPAGSTEELERLRSQSLHLVMNSLAEFARDAASRAEFDLCQRVLTIIRTSSFPSEILSAAEESVLGLYEDALVRTSKEITKRCWEDIRQDRASAELNAKPCSVAVDRWKQELESKYSNLVAMSGTRTKFGLRARQHYADFLISLGNALTWADQWMEAEKVLRQARSCLPGDSPARERIEALLLSIGGAAAEEKESERKRRKQNDIEGFETGAEMAGNTSSDERMAQGTGSIPARIAEPEPESSPSGNAFVELCHSITLQCWQQIKLGHFDANLLVFKAAHADYERRVAPWLTIVIGSLDRGSTRVVRQAAAKCLSSLAGGFISVGDLGTARTIALEALPLIADSDSDLESEVRRQLDYIASEMKQSAPKAWATHRSDNQAPWPGSANEEVPVTPRPEGFAKWLFVGNRVFVLEIAVVVTLAFLACLTVYLSGQPRPAVAGLANGSSEHADQPEAQQPQAAAPVPPVTGAAPIDYDALAEKYGAVDYVAPKSPDPVSLPNGTNLIPPPDGESAGTFTLENSSSSDDSVSILKDAVTVTLHAVAGNTRTEAISAEEFANDLGAAVVINNKR